MAALVYLLLALFAAASAAPESRIVGGTPTSIEEFPYIVALVYTYQPVGITVQRCVGCLVSSWHVLTSGFCYTGAINENMRVRAGSTNSLSGGTLVSIGEVIKHPDYTETPRQADVAVTFLTSPLGITNVINVLFLPPQGIYIPDGQSVKVVSWGFEYIGGPQLELLKTINLNKIGQTECEAQFVGNGEVAIGDRVICAAAAGRGLCSGDSGAPMVIDQTVVGIHSYHAECGDSYPNIDGSQLELLKTINVNKIGQTECEAQFADNGVVAIGDRVICAAAAGRGLCSGDSGAPMVIDQTVVGIHSYHAECGDSFPNVFTRIDRFTNWILSVAVAPSSDDASIRSRPLRL